MRQHNHPNPPNVEDNTPLNREGLLFQNALVGLGRAAWVTLQSAGRLISKALWVFWDSRGRRWKDTSLRFVQQAWQAFLEDVMHTR